MNDFCRLCLSFCPLITCTTLTEDCEILTKIRAFISTPITINNCLPNQVCLLCKEKVEEFHRFAKNVIQNQHILYHNYDKGVDNLNNFYLSLSTVKEEIKAITPKEDKENDSLNILTDQIDDHNDTDEKPIIIKQESATDNNPIEHSSDDDVTLSSIKIAKETTADVKKKKTSKKKSKSESRSTHTHNINSIAESAKTDINNDTYTKMSQEKHKCLTCFELFDSQSDLLRHYNTEHGHINASESGKAADLSKYTTVTAEDGTVTFKCDECGRVCDNKRAINSHVIVHVKSRPFICKICGRTYRTASEIIRHDRAHNGLKLECTYKCGYTTVYMGALKEHERRHENEFKYKCEKCNKGFLVKTWFLEHQNIHNGVKPFVCNICGLAFHMNRYLTTHRSTVHPQSSSLKRYICVHCDLPCDTRNTLTKHLKEHGINTTFLCDMCGKTLSNSVQLKLHKRVHLGVKPYTCSTCNKSFAKKFNLKLHENTHTGKRAHACETCGKRYTQRSILLRHNLRHHPTSSLKCSKCQKSFTTRNQHTSHEKLCI